MVLMILRLAEVRRTPRCCIPLRLDPAGLHPGGALVVGRSIITQNGSIVIPIEKGKIYLGKTNPSIAFGPIKKEQKRPVASNDIFDAFPKEDNE